jgi:hypothetical protein
MVSHLCDSDRAPPSELGVLAHGHFTTLLCASQTDNFFLLSIWQCLTFMIVPPHAEQQQWRRGFHPK